MPLVGWCAHSLVVPGNVDGHAPSELGCDRDGAVAGVVAVRGLDGAGEGPSAVSDLAAEIDAVGPVAMAHAAHVPQFRGGRERAGRELPGRRVPGGAHGQAIIEDAQVVGGQVRAAIAVTGVTWATTLSVQMIGHGLAVALDRNSKHAIKQVDRLLSNAGVDLWVLFATWVPYVLADGPPYGSQLVPTGISVVAKKPKAP